jgi:hypothetical protein
MRVTNIESYISPFTGRDSAHVGLPQLGRFASVGIVPGVMFYALYYMAWYPRHPRSGGGARREIDCAHAQAGRDRENSRNEGPCSVRQR